MDNCVLEEYLKHRSRSRWKVEGGSCAVRRRYASHITVVLSKTAHSGPSVCLRARAPCPLRVSRPRADRVSVQRELQVLALPRLVQDTAVINTHTHLSPWVGLSSLSAPLRQRCRCEGHMPGPHLRHVLQNLPATASHCGVFIVGANITLPTARLLLEWGCWSAAHAVGISGCLRASRGLVSAS